MNRMGAKRVRLAPWGQYTRYLLTTHIRHTIVIASALLCVALSVDLPSQIAKLLAAQPAPAAKGLQLAWFILLRGTDLLPRFLPLAVFFGVVWSHIALAASRERILIWNTGRSALQGLIPVLLLALILGACQFAFDAYLRPAAMSVQMRGRLGTLGEMFGRGLTNEAHWIALDDGLLQTRLSFSPRLALRDVTLYRLDERGRLREVDNAQSAVPTASAGVWLLQHGSYWIIPPENASGPAAVALFTRDTAASATYFEARRIALAADPLWLSVWGIYPEYLSQPALKALIRRPLPSGRESPFVTVMQFNRANALMPGAMALLAEMLCLLLFAYGVALHLQLAALAAGYAGHLAMKTLLLMGERNYLDPALAPWLTPIALLLACGVLFAVMQQRKGAAQLRAWRQKPGILSSGG